jgi:hypothetical protein
VLIVKRVREENCMLFPLHKKEMEVLKTKINEKRKMK